MIIVYIYYIYYIATITIIIWLFHPQLWKMDDNALFIDDLLMTSLWIMVTLPEGKPPMPKHWNIGSTSAFPKTWVYTVHQFPSLVIPLQPTLWILIEYTVYIYIYYIYNIYLKPLGFRGTHFFSNFREFCELTIIDKRVSPNGCLLRMVLLSSRPHLDPIRGSQEGNSPLHFPKLT